MASIPRYARLSDQSIFHITWQCHNEDWLLHEDWAKQIYYNLLLKYKKRYKVLIYSYCFMSSHPHMTGFCENAKLLSDYYRLVNSLFARIYNKRMKRRGQVVMDRFKSPVIHTDADLLKVMYYIDLNPNRAHMVQHPNEYPWSSFAYYAYGKEDALIDPSPSYLGLGTTPKERQAEYLAMVEDVLKNDWKEKRPYSSVPFIGNPDWVKRKTEELRKIRREKRQEWKKKFKLKFGSSPP